MRSSPRAEKTNSSCANSVYDFIKTIPSNIQIRSEEPRKIRKPTHRATLARDKQGIQPDINNYLHFTAFLALIRIIIR